MIAVVQRVKEARVSYSSKHREIKKGLLVLVGVEKEDDEGEMKKLFEKIVKLRIFSDENEKMNRSIREVGGEVLLVSQFTLLADLKGGNRPYFGEAALPELAEKLYLEAAEHLRKGGIDVKTGYFGKMMDVSLVNDGPVTIVIRSKDI